MCQSANHERNSIPEIAFDNMRRTSDDVTSVIDANMRLIHTANVHLDREILMVSGLTGTVASAINSGELPRDTDAIKAYLHDLVDSFRMNEDGTSFAFDVSAARRGELLHDAYKAESDRRRDEALAREKEEEEILTRLAEEMGVKRLDDGSVEGLMGFDFPDAAAAAEFVRRFEEAKRNLAAGNL